MSARQADRRADLARIHCLARDLGLSRAEYEDVVFVVARCRSAGDLDHAGRAHLIEHLSARLHTPRPRSVPRGFGQKPIVPEDRRPLIDKMEALLADAARPWNYARAMAKRMCGVDQLEWCTAEQLRKIVAALSYDQRRRAAREAR